MDQFLLTIEKIEDPPKKVLMMYQAIADLMKSHQDIKTLKVSEITRRAGIGKGTAYEYFSSKEELIANALVYEMKREIMALSERAERKTGFEAKIMCIFDWISENRDYYEMNWEIIQIYMGQFGGRDAMLARIPNELVEGVQRGLWLRISRLMQEGAREGIYAEASEAKRQIAFMTAMVEYAMAHKGADCQKGPCIADEELRQFVYSSMVKALTP